MSGGREKRRGPEDSEIDARIVGASAKRKKKKKGKKKNRKKRTEKTKKKPKANKKAQVPDSEDLGKAGGWKGEGQYKILLKEDRRVIG